MIQPVDSEYLWAVSEHRKARAGLAPCHPARDGVDAILEDWAVERPDLDFSPVGVITRLTRLRALFDAALLRVFARYGLSAADFQVIITLRRAGRPYRLAQSRLMTQLSLTSGTVSVRLERLAKAGIVTRDPDRDDKRGTLVSLTPHGLDLFDRVAPEHLANEDRLLSALDDTERDTLVGLLRRLLISLEDNPSIVGRPLGIALGPAPMARQRRTDVGLSDTPGLLVTEILDPTLAGDLRRGDLLTAVNGSPLRSESTLAEAIQGTRPDTDLRLEFLRGNDLLPTRITPRRPVGATT
jgi:DNA-binding MarR family transcriptional regulator